MARKSLRIEPLEEAHIAQVLAIEVESNSAPWSERSFRNELTNPQSVFRVAWKDGQIVGYGGLWTVVDEAHITTVAIAPDARRQGIGRQIMAELLCEARDRGMLTATLEVRRGNEPARQLYRNLGFQEVAVRKGYYPDNREDAVVMWLYNLPAWNPESAGGHAASA